MLWAQMAQDLARCPLMAGAGKKGMRLTSQNTCKGTASTWRSLLGPSGLVVHVLQLVSSPLNSLASPG